MQAHFSRIPVVADAAHSLGACRHGVNAGQAAELTAFSFHAVKNFTTAEGGALTWRSGAFDDDQTYNRVMLMSLHGQTKDALAKDRAGAWEYDIAFPGWKCNMTDVQAALGLAQLRRYPGLLFRTAFQELLIWGTASHKVPSMSNKTYFIFDSLVSDDRSSMIPWAGKTCIVFFSSFG